jgi:hypothetical protein
MKRSRGGWLGRRVCARRVGASRRAARRARLDCRGGRRGSARRVARPAAWFGGCAASASGALGAALGQRGSRAEPASRARLRGDGLGFLDSWAPSGPVVD